MNLKEKLSALATETNEPCVSISMNTHRTHPDNKKDITLLRTFIKEAEQRVISEFGKRPVSNLLEKITQVSDKIDANYHLESLHIYLSNTTEEIIPSHWKTDIEGVHISDRFAIRPLLKTYNRNVEYLLMLMSQSGVHLFRALNNQLIEEVHNDDFPFSENRHYNTHSDKGSDPKHLDDLVREYLNKVDKALVKVANDRNLNCLVICTEDNYSRLLQVADSPSVYWGYAPVDYNHCDTHHILKQSWEMIQERQKQERFDAVFETMEAQAQDRVIVSLNEIYEAAIDGKGDLLLVSEAFAQPVVMTGERGFKLVNDPHQNNAINDITSNICWEVISRGGRVVFIPNEEPMELGPIVLKTRY